MSDWCRTNLHPVHLRLADGTRLRGSIYLLDRVAHRPGPETPLEFMNRPEAFFVLAGEDGSVQFVGKNQVAYLDTDLAALDTEELAGAGGRMVTLEVTLALREAEVIEGRVRLDPHPTRPRALDLLNSPHPFFALLAAGQAKLVNSACTKLVRPQD